MSEKLSKGEFVEEMKVLREAAAREEEKKEARKAKQRECARKSYEKKKVEKAEAAGSLTIPAEVMEAMLAASNTIQSEPSCVLTKDEAYIVAEFIDGNLFDAIRNDTDWDSLYALRNLIRAYEQMCVISGYIGQTEPRKKQIDANE